MYKFENDNFENKLHSVFFPHDSECLKKITNSRKNFVHYTTASAATSIIKTKTIWLRQPYLMNDRGELALGLEFLRRAYREENFKFKTLIESYYPGIGADLELSFDNLLRAIKEEMYLFCVSEHENNESDCGRLSMWRGYGRDAGIAIILNHESFLTESPGLNAYLCPVFYSNYERYLENFEQIQKNIADNSEFIKTIGLDLFKNSILNMFRFSILSTKHLGFSEEKEWRIIYSPLIERSQNLRHSVEVINGIPQEVHSVRLENNQEKGLMKIELNDLIEKIIIGPTDYPLPLYKAFVKLLSDAGVENAAEKVVVSDIPLRV